MPYSMYDYFSPLFKILGSIFIASAPARALGDSARTGNFVAQFASPISLPGMRNQNIDYALNPATKSFLVHVPRGYSQAYAYGLVVYMYPGDQVDSLPAGWIDILDQRRLLFIAPNGAGDYQDVSRRLGLAVIAAREMQAQYHIDPNRIYAAGWSGGARMAGRLAFFQPDIFHGTIQSCGADFYRPVELVLTTSQAQFGGGVYGEFKATEPEILRAQRVRFTFITGRGDFRHGNIVDIVKNGYQQDGFQTRLFDVKGMGHQEADASILEKALDFIETSP